MEQGTGDWYNPAPNNKHSHRMWSKVKLTWLAITCTRYSAIFSVQCKPAYLKMELFTELLMCHVHLHVEGYSEDSVLFHLKIHTNRSLVVALKYVPAISVHTSRGRPDHMSCMCTHLTSFTQIMIPSLCARSQFFNKRFGTEFYKYFVTFFFNPLPRQHIRMLLISLFYSDVA